VGLGYRDYMKDEHYPSCTCVGCCRKRSERAAKENWCDRHSRPMGQSGCPVCLLESRGEGIPDDGNGGPPPNAIDGKATARGNVAGADDRGQSGRSLGRTLRSILGKRGSA